MNEQQEKPWVRICEVGDFEGREVTLKGWLYNKRSSGKIRFLLIRDGSGIIQGVMGKKDVPPEVFDRFEELTQESSMIVTGKIRADARAEGGYELSPITGFEIVQQAQEYPISPKEHGPDFDGVNGQVFLDGNDSLWVTSAKEGTTPGTWCWPERVE